MRQITVRSLTLFMLVVVGTTSSAQQPTPLGSQLIPERAMLLGVAKPAETLDSPALELYPTEIADAFVLERLGVPLRKVESVRIVVSSPGQNDAPFGAVLQFSEPTKLSDLKAQILGKKVNIEGDECLEFRGIQGVVLHQVKPGEIVIASANYFASLMSAKEAGKGALARVASEIDATGNVNLVVAIEPIRPLLNQWLQAQLNQIPPELADLALIPSLLDSVQLQVDLKDEGGGIRLVFRGIDEESSERFEQIYNQTFDVYRKMIVGSMTQSAGDDPIAVATAQYSERAANRIVEMLEPERDGTAVTVKASLEAGLTPQLLLLGVGFATPMRMAGPAQGPRIRATNNMKQIGLAFHNYHAAYRQLPTGIRDDQDKLLLSWRVQILPFIEEQALYEQFHLDEPWDSEHNIKLLAQMPEVFKHPNIPVAPGKTIYQTPVGDDTMFPVDDSDSRFRDVLDGLSNTVMAVQTDAVSAVEWTKPSDWEADLKAPFKGLAIRGGSFEVLFGDGAVISLTKEIGEATMSAILTRANREFVDLNR